MGPPVSPPWDPMVPPVSLPRDRMTLPMSPAQDPAAPLVSFLWYPMVPPVSPPRDPMASRVALSRSGGASCISCLRSCDTGCCSSSSSSSCTDSSLPGFTPRSSSPTPWLPVLPGPSVHCTACRLAFACKRASQGPHWAVVAIPIA